MRLERLTLNGMTRFTSPVTVRFDQLPAGSLVAIVGENGSGKTTILDSTLAALYREMPSRGEKPLIEYANGKNAYIEQVFTVGPIRYKARVSMDALTGRADAVLHRELDGKWVALNDGKVSTFKVAVADRFLPLEVVLASAFAAQNKAGSFLTMDRAGRKDLFTALLGLAHYEKMAESCRASALKLDRRRAELVALLARLDGDVTPAAETLLIELGKAVAADLAEALRVKDELDAKKPGLAATADAAIAAQVKASNGVEARRALLADKERLATLIANREADILRVQKLLAEALERIEDQRVEDQRVKRVAIAQVATAETVAAQLAKRLEFIDAKEIRDISGINTKIQNNQTELIDKSDAIRTAAKRLAETDADLAVLRARIVAARGNVDGAETKLRAFEAALLAKAGAAERFHAAVDAAGLIDEVPCGGKAPYDGCKLLGAAKAAKQSIPALEFALVEFYEAEKAVEAQRTEVKLLKSIVTGTDTQIAEGEVFRQAYAPLGNRLEQLNVAVKRVEELKEQLQAVQQEAETSREEQRKLSADTLKDADAHRTRMEAELAAIGTRADEDILREKWQTGVRVKEIEKKIESDTRLLATTNVALDSTVEAEQEYLAAVDAAKTAIQAVNRHNDAIALQAGVVAKAEADQRNADRLWAEFQTKAAEKVSYQVELAPLEQNQVEFEILAKCFGREGLPVLEIDAAGPAISDLTNDLLRSCFESSRFTVELVTQQPKADGKGMKEVFELRVFDAERGGEPRDLTDLSGGEQIIVDEALKSAIAIYVNQSNAQPLETCWRDETTGALDPENAVRYVNLLRRLQERGGFNQVLYITHNEEAAAMADVQLVVANGGVTVRHAPFTEAA